VPAVAADRDVIGDVSEMVSAVVSVVLLIVSQRGLREATRRRSGAVIGRGCRGFAPARESLESEQSQNALSATSERC
jgi:hypothetical protein